MLFYSVFSFFISTNPNRKRNGLKRVSVMTAKLMDYDRNCFLFKICGIWGKGKLGSV